MVKEYWLVVLYAMYKYQVIGLTPNTPKDEVTKLYRVAWYL